MTNFFSTFLDFNGGFLDIFFSADLSLIEIDIYLYSYQKPNQNKKSRTYKHISDKSLEVAPRGAEDEFDTPPQHPSNLGTAQAIRERPWACDISSGSAPLLEGC